MEGLPDKKPYIVAFTWSPKTILQRNDPQEGYKIHLPVLRRLASCCSKIQLNPEFFVSGGLHYHAQLVIADQIKWFKSVLPYFKSQGFVVVKKYPDDQWLKYIGKDWDSVSAVLALEKPLDLMTIKKKGKSTAQSICIQRDMEDYISVEPPLTLYSTSTSDTDTV